MIDQIKTILKREGISASQLAEKMGIQRSSISHILSQRNKPSLDFIQKLIAAFPHIDSKWIMSGEGNYTKTIAPLKPTVQQETFHFSPSTLEPKPEPKPQITPEIKSEITQPKTPSSNPLFSDIKRGTKKKAIKVITFYDDNTFDEYFPS